MASGIYAITNITNRKQYIGSAADFRKRWKLHTFQLRHGKHHSNHLQHAFDKDGENAFVFSIIETCDIDSLIEREEFYIETLKPAYNIVPHAGSPRGHKLSLETRAKMSASLVGHTRNLGRFPSIETRIKMSEAQIKRNQDYKVSPETRAKLSAANMGNKSALGAVRSPETRAKISQSKRGKILSPEHRNATSLGMIGRVVTLETRAKISSTLKGRKSSQKTKEKLSNIVRLWWANKKSKEK